jgi:putative thioredoxin
MTQQPFSTAALRGAVDLGAIAAANQRKTSGGTAGPSAVGAGGFVVEVTEAEFQSVVIDQSMTVPVVVDLWTGRAQQSVQMSATLDKLAAEYAGAFLVARVDIDTNPALVQAFQVQTLPFVVAVVSGQPVPLAADVVPEAQLRQILDKLLEVAAQNGVTGRVAGAPEVAADAEGEGPVEPELPTLHQAAYDAIDSGDLAAAAASYEQAIRENPADDLAAVGLINVQLMQRTDGVDPAAALAAADAAPDDTAAQLLAADVDLLEGRTEVAFDRLVEAVRARSGAEREEVRQRLVDLFALVGADDPQVRKARIALTNALF